jgi:hypothetical protein
MLTVTFRCHACGGTWEGDRHLDPSAMICPDCYTPSPVLTEEHP